MKMDGCRKAVGATRRCILSLLGGLCSLSAGCGRDLSPREQRLRGPMEQLELLYAMLRTGHHDVKLPPEDLRRLALWLDTGGNFFGAYHNYEGQARGELGVSPLIPEAHEFQE